MNSFENPSNQIDMLANLAKAGAPPEKLILLTVALLPKIVATAPPNLLEFNQLLVHCCNLLDLPIREKPTDTVIGPIWLRAACYLSALSNSISLRLPNQNS